MRITPAQLAAQLAKVGAPAPTTPAKDEGQTLRRAVELNRTEARYAEHLDGLVAAGLVRRYWPHPMSLRTGPSRQFYRPDFLVERMNGRLVLVEVKATWSDGRGHVEDDSLEKFKTATAEYPPFDFLMVRADPGGGWVTMYRSEGAADL